MKKMNSIIKIKIFYYVKIVLQIYKLKITIKTLKNNQSTINFLIIKT